MRARATALVVGGVAVVVLLGWALALRGAGTPVAAPRLEGTAAAPAAAAAPAEAATRIELLLLPDGPVRAIPGSVRIGLAHVSEDDAARAPLHMNGQAEQAGPRDYHALATVTRWLAAPAQLLDDGRVRVGPLLLPPADRYVLQARGEDGLRFYAARFAADAVPARVAPVIGAAVRTRLSGPGGQVLLRRREAATATADAAIWQPLQAWAAPGVYEAFGEQPLPVRDGQVLAPLAPGPVELVLEVDGVEAERRSLTLQAGRIVEVRFDPEAEAVARAVSIDLELEFVRSDDGAPVPGLQVQWLGGHMPRQAATDAQGRVRFQGLDRQAVQAFDLLAPPRDGDALPDWPESWPLQLDPEVLAGTGSPRELIRHRVELTPLRWLVARSPPRRSAETRGRSPYPIHVLQRERDGAWQDVRAAHFVATADGLAVSIAEPGRYRVATALSPWQVVVSSGAQVRDAARAYAHYPAARGSDVSLTILRDGKPLAGVPVHLVAPLGTLPPEVLLADSRGSVRLGAATVPRVLVEVPGSDQIEVRLAGPTVLADFGLQRAR